MNKPTVMLHNCIKMLLCSHLKITSWISEITLVPFKVCR